MSDRQWTEERVGPYLVRGSLSPDNPLWLDYEIQDECTGPDGLQFETCARGFVKWDGCQEISEVEAVHFCRSETIEDFKAALLVARRMASTMIAEWEGT